MPYVEPYDIIKKTVVLPDGRVQVLTIYTEKSGITEDEIRGTDGKLGS